MTDLSNKAGLRVHTRKPKDISFLNKLIKRRQCNGEIKHLTNSLIGKNKPLSAGPSDCQRPPLLTCFFWPILCARACACKSFWGFQSESKMTTVSAEARLIPRPPARVESRKQKSCTQCNILLYAVAFSETLSQSNKPSHLETPAGVKKMRYGGLTFWRLKELKELRQRDFSFDEEEESVQGTKEYSRIH